MTSSNERTLVQSPGKRFYAGVLKVPSLLLSTGALLTGLKERIDFTRGLHGFRARPDDIFLVTYPRSGTTWTQMILYQLTTAGNMDFEHISQVSPWLERALVTNPQLVEQAVPPRLLKSHLHYVTIPKFKDCKYIYVARDGRDVAVSMFHFMGGGSPQRFKEMFNHFMTGQMGNGSWFDHVAEWHKNKAGLDLLFLTYESMKRDLAESVRRIAEFIGVELDDAKLGRVLERCSVEFMKAHDDKFSYLTELRLEQNLGSQFVRKGQAGDGKAYFGSQMEQHYQRQLDGMFGGTGLRDMFD